MATVAISVVTAVWTTGVRVLPTRAGLRTDLLGRACTGSTAWRTSVAVTGASAAHTTILTSRVGPRSVTTASLHVAVSTVTVADLVIELVVSAIVRAVFAMTVCTRHQHVTAVSVVTVVFFGPLGVALGRYLAGLGLAVVAAVRVVGTSVAQARAHTTERTVHHIIPVVTCTRQRTNLRSVSVTTHRSRLTSVAVARRRTPCTSVLTDRRRPRSIFLTGLHITAATITIADLVA